MLGKSLLMTALLFPWWVTHRMDILVMSLGSRHQADGEGR